MACALRATLPWITLPLRCAIFDLDQTVAATARLLFDSWNAAMHAIGRPPSTDAEIVALFGPPEWVALREVAGARDYPRAIDAYLRHYHAQHGQVRVFDGIPELLSRLGERHVFRGMITGKGRATAEVTLVGIGLRAHFDLVLTGDELTRPKPAPDGILQMLDDARCPPGDAVMIGDMPADVLCARAAGVRPVAALWDCAWRDEVLALRPGLAFESVAGLRGWIERQIA